MDNYAGKRAANGRVLPRKAVALRDMGNTGDQDMQVCHRIGFSGRMNKKGKEVASEKAKTSRSSLHSLKGKEVYGGTLRSFQSSSKPGNSSSETRKKLLSRVETGSYKVSSIQAELEASKLTSLAEIQKGLELQTVNSDSKISHSVIVGSSSVAVNTRSKTNLIRKAGGSSQLSLRSSSFPSVSKSSAQMTCYPTSRYGVKNFRCNSISDNVPSSSSSSDLSLKHKNGSFKKRFSEGESRSSAKGKKISDPSSFERHPNSGLSISISETRQQRISTTNRENYLSTKTQRPSSSSRARVPNQGTVNKTSTNKTLALVTPVCQSEGHIETDGGLHAMMSIASSDVSSVRDFQNYNTDGTEEISSELQRIQREVELTYEQPLEMFSYISLFGLNFNDQHRDMRLDTDNMSYEELLALEERMGTVSTALSEEDLLKCLKRCTYQLSPEEGIGCAGDEGDVKCSICQEEYVARIELGRLLCGHRYHVQCIQQWLRLKNWCPICKASADAS